MPKGSVIENVLPKQMRKRHIYNGSAEWQSGPEMRRANIPRDSGNMVSDGDYLYVAVKDKCWKINGNSGEIVGLFEQVTLGYEWGYVAYAEKQLFGSSVKKLSLIHI